MIQVDLLRIFEKASRDFSSESNLSKRKGPKWKDRIRRMTPHLPNLLQNKSRALCHLWQSHLCVPHAEHRARRSGREDESVTEACGCGASRRRRTSSLRAVQALPAVQAVPLSTLEARYPLGRGVLQNGQACAHRCIVDVLQVSENSALEFRKPSPRSCWRLQWAIKACCRVNLVFSLRFVSTLYYIINLGY